MRQTLSTTSILIVVSIFGLHMVHGGDSQRGTDLRLANAAEKIRNVQRAAPAAQAPAEPAPKADPELPAPRTPPRDPTEPGEELRDLVAPFRMGQPGRPGAAGLAVPRVTLKGRIIGPKAPPAAIVELHGAVYVLHEESELTVDGPEAALGGLTLHVKQITSSEVRIEVLPLGKIMVLR